MNYNRYNFYRHTFCAFTEVDSVILNSLKLSYKSKKGSSYYFTNEGVYRVANHWGRVANCRWRLLSLNKKVNQINRIGFAKWTDFYPNNETEKLFYLEFDEELNKVSFLHKDNPNYDGKALLRTAKEMQKAIADCTNILETDNWAKYLETNNINLLRFDFISQIINRNTSLLQLKREFLIATSD